MRTYTGELVKIHGEAVVTASYKEQTHQLTITVVDGDGPPLMGRDWLQVFKLDWNSIFSFSSTKSNLKLDTILERNCDVFQGVGLLNDREVKIHVKEGANPKFCKARQPPFMMREKIEKEIDRLEKDGIMSKVTSADWASPIVPVLKKDNSVRICGDYKSTLNKAVHTNQHPIPLIEDLAQKLAHGKKFTELDFSHAYTQLKLHPSSRQYTTVNTHKGLYEYNRLCFGISSSPGIFQSAMESLFQDIPNCCVYFDNLYVTGRDDQEHLETLDTVLKLIKEKGLKLRREKCQFFKEEINFLGHCLSSKGLRPQAEKVRAIREAPEPTNRQQLQSFLGLVNYFAKFIPNLSQSLAPLYSLLKKNAKWQWNSIQESSFRKVKAMLTCDRVLCHYDPNKKLILTCDASPDGVGAILAHVQGNEERPIAFASRSLSSSEKNYSQLDREALAIVFAVRKFHKFIFGRRITIFTDHKPLLGLFAEDRQLPIHASSRVQRWAITLAAYDYQLKHVPGLKNCADALSRLPVGLDYDTEPYVPDDIDILFSIIDNSPLSACDIAKETKSDETLSLVLNYCLNGWPDQFDEQLRPFSSRKNELSVENDCLLWGVRVIVPKALTKQILELLHEAHTGASKMKSLARSWFWWPKMDCDIENFVKCCYSCQKHSKQPPKAPLHNWDWPAEPWTRLHLDFAGPFLNKMFLILVDAHSKWLDVRIMNGITASETILELREIFATHGLPLVICTDNGPTFTSLEFNAFCHANGIQHVTTSPYKPSTNGLAERAVGTFKTAMVKMGAKGSLRERVSKFLTKYRITPHITTGVSPSELLLGRRFRTHLDLIHPTLQKTVSQNQIKQKMYHDRSSRIRDIHINDDVFVRNYSGEDKWVPGKIIESTGPVSFRVNTDKGIIRRHQDQMKVISPDCIESSEPEQTMQGMPLGAQTTAESDSPINCGDSLEIPDSLRSDPQPLRRSQRQIKKPLKLDL